MKDVFVLGAGFSKAINAAMPTMDELSHEVIARIEKTSSFPIQDTLYALGNNIELWMTYLSQPQPWLREEHHYRNMALASDIRRHISQVVTECTAKSVTCPIPEWLPLLIELWHSQRSVIVTLNYDTLVERAARKVSIPGNANDLAESMYPPYFSNLHSRTGEFTWGEGKTETFAFFNLHGSTHLYYSGRDTFYGETIFRSKAPPWDTKYASYEASSRLRAGDKTPLIIPPVTDKLTYFNNKTIRWLWQEASLALQAARRIFVIGYSLPISDLGMQFFLQYSQAAEGTPLYIIDRNEKIVTRYKGILPKLSIRDQFVGEREVVHEFIEAYPNLPLD